MKHQPLPSHQTPTQERPFLAPLTTGWRAFKYHLIAGGWLIAAGWFWAWWLRPDHVIGVWRFAIVTGAMAWIYGMQLYFVLIFLQARRSVAPNPQPGQWRVAMIVTKTPAEPFEVVRRTLEAMLAQDYPHDTWLADEDPASETIAWCATHGVKISSRKGIEAYHRAEWPRRTRCKEGNLAYFYDTWGYRDYDIVSQLDADHVPQPGYLRAMLRPFADPAVGYVSAPSICGANAAQSWSARTRLYSEAAFHGVFQAGYTGVLTPMCIGSHYAVRTAALKQVGGLGPELAEDHSTTMLMASGGWRGVHAIDAIAMGDGPANLPDLVTQEFQWSRSLLSLLLRYTPRYLRTMPLRLKLLFLLCQTWYVFFAISMAMMYLVPIIAVTFDIRIADVTYPAFLGHSLPAVLAMIVFAYSMRRDGFFRPREAKVIAWEKALFVTLQWPWVVWGCVMAVRDRLTGRFVDFRITPKGTAASARLPGKIVAVYALLALGALVPVIAVGGVTEARGFYLLSLVNTMLYLSLVAVTIVRHLIENRIDWRQQRRAIMAQTGTLTAIALLTGTALWMRGEESLQALIYGLSPVGVTQAEYVVSGAGMGKPGEVRFRFNPELWEAIGQFGQWR
ncbi:glycosyltransferase family 2 protein [Sedimentimonas flavescens]|uniref:glycosyltransferase family 2 protein n=1 Tax=Sedimentimonas flavescens TaxID=2851012 RepID=UPI001C4A07B4|nr:glycosyltransferase [Sedimentimonas flavescens]MBW0157319.1 glycosyltransferase [Sedimentimonas flavescens]